MKKGTLFAATAFVVWGLFPVYWRWLHAVAPLQLISHRVVWSWLILVGAVVVLRQQRSLLAALRKPKVLGLYLAAAVLICINWLVYIWAVNAGFVIETSLGYFINPLFSVLLGVIVLRERLRPWQWLPVGLATIGVLFLTYTYGSPPWIALSLAMSFAGYGLIKKTAPLNSLQGLTLETGLLLVPALLFLGYAETQHEGAFLHSDALTSALLVGAGAITTIPLLLFASAARRTPLSTLGLLQYIAPTIQFLLGIMVFHEDFSEDQLVGFGLVWAALIIFAAGGLLSRRSRADVVLAQTRAAK